MAYFRGELRGRLEGLGVTTLFKLQLKAFFPPSAESIQAISTLEIMGFSHRRQPSAAFPASRNSSYRVLSCMKIRRISCGLLIIAFCAIDACHFSP